MANPQNSPPSLTLWASKPRGRPATMLAEMGIDIVPIEEEEGNVGGHTTSDRYIVSERLAVERRTGSAFSRGIRDKTLFTSAIYLREHFDIPVLIVEGQVNLTYSAFNLQAIRGALTSMIVLYGISVLSTPDVHETVALLAMLARQEQVGVPEISLIPKRKATDLADLQRRVIEMLPGCGLTIARDLLQRFGSVQRIVNATKDELRTIHGIGDKRAAEIHQVLHAEYASVDTEKDLEDAIAVAPELLFERPVSLLARQHYICTRAGERYVIDLVFADEAANDLILVELKRGQLARKHEEQLLRYMDHADESPLLRARTRAGAQLRGMLATVTRNSYRAQGGNIAVRIVDRQRTIEVLKRLRRQGIKANQAQDMRMGQSTAIGSAGHTEDSG